MALSGSAVCGIDGDQRQIGLLRGDLFRQRLEAGFGGSGIATRTAAGCNCSTARDASAQAGFDDRKHLRIVERAANDGRPAVDTTMIGPCWDIWKLGSTRSTEARDPSLPALMPRQRRAPDAIS